MIRAYWLLKSVGVDVGFGDLVGMKLRRTLSKDLVSAWIASEKSVRIPIDQLETHALAGGNVPALVKSAIWIEKHGEAPDITAIGSADLRGCDVLTVAKAYVEAKRAFPELTQAEFFDRSARGEDPAGEVRGGGFLPLERQEGWIVRVDSRPMSGAEVAALLRDGKIPETALVKPPGSDRWVSPAEAAERLGAPSTPNIA